MENSKYKVVLLIVLLLIGGCATAPKVSLDDGGRIVKVGKSDPSDNFTEVGPITTFDGKGCGGFGYLGTYDRAVILLKNKAAEIDGDYVQIFTLTEPHFRPGCFDNVYKISGTLFKKTSDSPSPLPILETSKPSNADRLRELKGLLDDGIISEDEFNEQKRRILDEGF